MMPRPGLERRPRRLACAWGLARRAMTRLSSRRTRSRPRSSSVRPRATDLPLAPASVLLGRPDEDVAMVRGGARVRGVRSRNASTCLKGGTIRSRRRRRRRSNPRVWTAACRLPFPVSRRRHRRAPGSVASGGGHRRRLVPRGPVIVRELAMEKGRARVEPLALAVAVQGAVPAARGVRGARRDAAAHRHLAGEREWEVSDAGLGRGGDGAPRTDPRSSFKR